MANLKEIRTRISSVISTRQITSAMKMVSAAKLRKAQDNIIQLRPFTLKLSEILYRLNNTPEESIKFNYIEEREIKRILLVVITSNKGLCGAFNSNAVKSTVQYIAQNYAHLNESNVDIISIGKKGTEFFKSRNYNLVNSYDDIFDDPSYNNVVKIAKTIINDFLSHKYDKVELVYNQFKNAGLQELILEQYLPLQIEQIPEEENGVRDFIYEPDLQYLMDKLIPRYLETEFYKAILESIASEHGARMTAMHKATDNATELIQELRIHYNKARQASITTEILEIVGGAEALDQ